MPLTIREAMKFGGLFGARVAAGGENLDNVIESISVLEVAESTISKWVIENQLYITSFYAIWDDIEMQKIVIQSLINCGCCGLVVCNYNTWIRKFDESIIRLCNENHFPLLIAREEVSYVEIMNPIINILYQEKETFSAPSDFSNIKDDFFNLIINEDEIEVVLNEMVRRLDKKITFFDIYCQEVYSNKDPAIRDQEKEYLKQHFDRILNACGRLGYAPIEISDEKQLAVLIRSRKKLFGAAFIDMKDTDSEKDVELFVNPLVLSCSLLFSRQGKIQDFRERMIQEYVADLIVWNFPSNETAVLRGKEIGFSIQDKNYIVLINVNSIQQAAGKQKQAEIQDYTKRIAVPKILQYIKEINGENWLAFRSDTILLFLNDTENELDLTQICTRLMQFFGMKDAFSISIGVSRYFESYTSIPDAYYEAFHTAILGREYLGENRITFPDEVWFFQKLHQLQQDDENVKAAHRLIRPLADYDAAHETALVRTLWELLEANGNIMMAAQRMYVHKNTMLQRKNKIISLLGYSPFEMPYIISFLMAMEILTKTKTTR